MRPVRSLRFHSISFPSGGLRPLRFICFLLGLFSAFFPVLPLRAESGYIGDVAKERSEEFHEIFLFIRKPPAEKKLVDSIFNPELSREFRERYREKFGKLDSESIVYQRGNFTTMDPIRYDLNRKDQRVIEQHRERRMFAEYMTRRLAEWHVDNYFKNEPSMRPVYELKETLSHVNVEVNKETKVEMHYNFSANVIDVVVDNPYLDSKLSIEMDPRAVGPGAVQENRVILGKQIDPRHRVNNHWATLDGLVLFEYLTQVTSTVSTSVATIAKYTPSGRAEGSTRYLVGLNYIF